MARGEAFGDPGGGVLARVPGVEVGVEVQEGDGGVVDGVEGAQRGEGDGVVAAEGDDFRVGVGGRVGEGERAPGEELGVGFGHLAEGQDVVD